VFYHDGVIFSEPPTGSFSLLFSQSLTHSITCVVVFHCILLPYHVFILYIECYPTLCWKGTPCTIYNTVWSCVCHTYRVLDGRTKGYCKLGRWAGGRGGPGGLGGRFFGVLMVKNIYPVLGNLASNPYCDFVKNLLNTSPSNFYIAEILEATNAFLLKTSLDQNGVSIYV
jgi:hypothetical protein